MSQVMQSSHDSLKAQAERIRGLGFLGQARLLQLFDYLAQCTASGRVPKEAEVAVEVFGRSSTADLSQDASVRVYVHNLRRKLDQYYGGPGRHEPDMLVLPKGEYRLQVLPNPLSVPLQQPSASAPASPSRPPPPRPPLGRYVVIGCIAAACLVAMAAAALWMQRRGPIDAMTAARTNAFWAPLLAGDRPILLVVGDYYIFGDTGSEDSMNVTRLIRDFTVNSRSDLQRYLMSRPEDASRYQDVGLSYLPTSSAYALANLMPVLAPVKSRVRVTLASELNPVMVKNSNLIYVGLLSGMGALQGPAFSASRFQFGDSFDELIDRRSRQHYISQAVDYADDQLRTGDPMYRDYGYFSNFTGPTGNRIIVIAGMQDEGLRQDIDFLTDRANLDQLARQVPGREDFEGLLEVSGMNHLNLSGKLLLASPLAAAAWRFDGTGRPSRVPSAPGP